VLFLLAALESQNELRSEEFRTCSSQRRHGRLQIVFQHKPELRKTSILWDREIELKKASILWDRKAELKKASML
jgi:hypothetical protein